MLLLEKKKPKCYIVSEENTIRNKRSYKLQNRIGTHILGTEWTVEYSSLKEDNRLDETIGGYCDNSDKLIVVRRFEEGEYDIKNINSNEKHNLKHEIVHAYLCECGLEENSSYSHAWAVNEEMVDWIAHQCHKIEKTYNEVCQLLFEDHKETIEVHTKENIKPTMVTMET